MLLCFEDREGDVHAPVDGLMAWDLGKASGRQVFGRGHRPVRTLPLRTRTNQGKLQGNFEMSRGCCGFCCGV